MGKSEDTSEDASVHSGQQLEWPPTTLVEELQAELTARTALLADIEHQITEGNRRAKDAEQLSHLDPETARALNLYIDEVLKHRLAAAERSARGREWLIGTAVAIPAGILAIVLAHFLVGF